MMQIVKAAKPVTHTDLNKAPARPLALVFADISKSSRIYECLGDYAAQEVIGRVLRRLSEQARRFDGHVVKTVGDAVICTFEQTESAIEAARSMLQAMKRPIKRAGDVPEMPQINIHVGIHYGSVVPENEDIFGDAVNITARVVDYANPRQIVATRSAIETLPEACAPSHKFLGSMTAKNISGEIELFEMVFEAQDLTTVLDTRKLSESSATCLYLIWGEEVLVVDSQRPAVSIGREDYNDVVMRCAWISRTHAHIENRNGVFVVNDKSTNGTFVYPSSAEPLYIKKGEQPLSGEGAIIFGREKEAGADEDFTDSLRYALR